MCFTIIPLFYFFSIKAAQSAKIEKVEKLAADLITVGVRAESAQDSLTQANEQLRVDIEKWQETKDVQWSGVMQSWANNHVDYHKKVCIVCDYSVDKCRRATIIGVSLFLPHLKSGR